jgi:hypothetical protein
MTQQTFQINGRIIEELLGMPPKKHWRTLVGEWRRNSDSVCDRAAPSIEHPENQTRT